MKKLFSSSKLAKAPPLGPEQYVRLAAGNLDVISQGTSDERALGRAVDELSKNMKDIKEILYGDTERFPTPELGAQLAAEIFRGDFFRKLIFAIPLLDFDTRRVASLVVANLQRQKVNNRMIASEYLASHTDVIDHMILGYENSSNALFYGSMLRDCIRHQAVTQYILDSSDFAKFFGFIELPSFEVASDAALTFREILTRHKSTVAKFLDKKFDWFFVEFRKLLMSPNYITRRLSIKILGEILGERTNSTVLRRFVADLENLKAVMFLLKDPNTSIKVEAIRVFKVFAVSESRPSEVTKVLFGNKEKLVRVFTDFKLEKEDPVFEQEKTTLLEAISKLEVN